MILLSGNKFINTSNAAYVSVLDNGPSKTVIYALAGGEHCAQIDVDHVPLLREDQVKRRRSLAAEIAKDAGSLDAYEVTSDLTLRML